MKIIPITDKNQLNSLQASQPQSQFLQSWEWGEFQKAVGRKVWRLGIEEKGHLTTAVTAIKHNLPFGKSYLYLPRVVTSHSPALSRVEGSLVTRELEKISRSENSIFIKIERASKTPPPTSHLPLLKTKHTQPPTTLLLDLSKSEDELLKNMHQKTRYNIRLAEKKAVKVRCQMSEVRGIEEFLKLNRETTARDKFKSHTDDYYKKMWQALGVNQQCNNETMKQCRLKIFTAYYKNHPIASNIIILFSDTTTYLHGASSNEHRNLMAPHLLQWEVIKYAKSHGYKYYDFWGVNPDESKNLPHHYKESWAGFTRFKRGFVSDNTGKEINFPDCNDLILKPNWYKLYKIIKTIKL